MSTASKKRGMNIQFSVPYVKTVHRVPKVGKEAKMIYGPWVSLVVKWFSQMVLLHAWHLVEYCFIMLSQLGPISGTNGQSMRTQLFPAVCLPVFVHTRREKTLGIVRDLLSIAQLRRIEPRRTTEVCDMLLNLAKHSESLVEFVVNSPAIQKSAIADLEELRSCTRGESGTSDVQESEGIEEERMCR